MPPKKNRNAKKTVHAETSTSEQPTRWGIVSAGKISHDFVTALRTLPESEHDVVAIAARDIKRAQEFAQLHNIRKFYNKYEELALDPEIDVVYIGTVNSEHYHTTLTMLKGRKHVLCEKPLSMNAAQTSAIISNATACNLFLMEGIWSRFFPLYENVKNEIASGRLGHVHQVTVTLGFNMSDVERLNRNNLGGGTVLDLAVYGLQFACWIFNNEKPYDIKASGCINSDGVDVSATIILHYSNNRTATIVTSSQVDLLNEACICGTKAMLKMPKFWCPTSLRLPDDTIQNTPLPQLQNRTNYVHSAGLRFEAQEVRTCLLKGLLQSPKMTHHTSLLLAHIEDTIRAQLGVVYSEDLSMRTGS